MIIIIMKKKSQPHPLPHPPDSLFFHSSTPSEWGGGGDPFVLSLSLSTVIYIKRVVGVWEKGGGGGGGLNGFEVVGERERVVLSVERERFLFIFFFFVLLFIFFDLISNLVLINTTTNNNNNNNDNREDVFSLLCQLWALSLRSPHFFVPKEVEKYILPPFLSLKRTSKAMKERFFLLS